MASASVFYIMRTALVFFLVLFIYLFFIEGPAFDIYTLSFDRAH